jgi:mono/diheme cytochrome c family protein
MKYMAWFQAVLFFGVAGVSLTVAGCGEGGEGPIVAPPPPPPEYADKHMPAGWWADEKIIEEGRQIFIGAKNIDVNCASCHGKDGKPVKAGARDFRNAERMKLYSDSVWFWRISEGVPNTKMKPWKSKLPEEDRWKVMAFERTFGLKGKEYDVVKKGWVPIGGATASGAAGTDGTATPAGGATAPPPPAAKTGGKGAGGGK